MKIILKRIISLVMIILMLCCSIVGCSKDNKKPADNTENNTENNKEEPITLTVYSELSSWDGLQQGWGAKVLLDKFNVKLHVTYCAPESFGSDWVLEEPADILIFGGSDNYAKAVNESMLYDWNEADLLKTHGAYIYENMSAALAKNKSLTSDITGGESDALYGFGHDVATDISDHEAYMYLWDIRWDLYSQLDNKGVNNLDDLIDVLTDMKALCPKDFYGEETYAVTMWPDWDVDNVMYVKSLASAYYGYDELGMGLYNVETGEYYDTLKQDGPYMEMLKFFNKLYQKDLLDPASRTQTYEDASKKLMAGGAFWSIFGYAGSLSYNTEENIKADKIMASLVPKDATPIVYGLAPQGGNRICTIGADTEHPELCMDIINWLCTPEGYMTYLYGPKELCWNYDEDGYTHFTEFGRKAYFNKDTKMEGDYEGLGSYGDGCFQLNFFPWSIYASNPDSNGEVYSCTYWKSEQKEAKCDTESDWRCEFNLSSSTEYLDTIKHIVAPPTTFKLADKSAELKAIWDNVASIIKKYSWDAIYADSDAQFDQIVSNMMAEADAAGYAQCTTWAKEQAALRQVAEEQLRATID